MLTLLDPDDIDRLRDALDSADFRPGAVADRFGAVAVSDSQRGDHRALLTATENGSPAATLVRLFRCGTAEPRAAVRDALAPLTLDAALAAGLVRHADDDRMAAGLGLDWSGDHWVLCDLPAELGGTVTAEHVLGVGGASRSLSQYLLRRPVATAVDIGTGGGVQALALSEHAGRVTATDVLPRAIRFAATNAALNGVEWELLTGDLLEPVRGRRFDQVVCNPPFIVGPGPAEFTYRDSGRAGDRVCAELAAGAADLLTPAGTMQFLANWLHVVDEDWRDRVAGWFAGTDVDVWVLQREVAAPLDYVRLWQRDAGRDHDPRGMATWLDWFDANRVEAVGFGVVNVRRRTDGAGVVVCEDFRHQPVVPFHRLVSDWFDAAELLAGLDTDAVLDRRWRVADGVRLEQEAGLGEQGWQVERQVLSDPARSGRREEIEPLLVNLLAGCTGAVDLRTLVGLLARAHDAPEPLLAASLATVVTGLVRRGLLVVAD